LDMPTSSIDIVGTVTHWAWMEKPKRILDVGVGHGKYGLMVREYLEDQDVLDGVEAEPRYLEMFPWVKSIYDHVFEQDATTLTKEQLDVYDVILMVDVIEHMEKQQGLDLLDRIRGAVIICTPVIWFENPEAHEGWLTESHRSHWTLEDFGGRVKRVDANARKLGGHLVVLSATDQ